MNNPSMNMFNAAGTPDTPPTTSLDLPPALASILSMGSPASTGAGMQGGMSSAMGASGGFAPSYEQGGMIGPGGIPEYIPGMQQGMPQASGMPQPTGMSGGMGEPTSVGLAPQGQMQEGEGMSPQMLDMQVNQFASQHPQQVEQIRAAIMQVMHTGELTQEELNMVVQLATVAAQNPEMYPYVRNFAIQQGIATEQDIPAQYDQGLVFVLLLAARAIQSDQGGQNMMQGGSPAMAGAAPMPQAQGAIPSMAKGGMTPDSKKADGSVLINAHEGEYVIPSNVVKMKGREFFDSLVEKYKEN
jgi:hypothetical protein